MSETTELKPCPFCGSAKVGCDGGNIPPNFAYCVDCGAFGPNAEDGSPEAATAAWNNRADNALAARVETLEAAVRKCLNILNQLPADYDIDDVYAALGASSGAGSVGNE